MDTTNLNLLWTSLMIEELSRHGIIYYCLSPGSRSAPLAVAIARNPSARAVICFDERAAAFHALGYARATARPAVLVCTSGTAAAQFFPAVVEASQDGIPMLILTADVPPEMHDCGANQAIRQGSLYGSFVRWNFDFPCPDLRIRPTMVLTTVDEAVRRSLHPDPGPVHLNLPFRDPLAPFPVEIPATYLESLSPWQERKDPFTRSGLPRAAAPDGAQLEELESSLAASKRGLLILGRLPDAAEREAALELANALRWPVVADILSGLRLDSRLATQIPYCDQLLHTEAFAAVCRPDTVLQIGGGYVSGNLLKQIAAHPPRQMIHLASRSGRQDPNHQVGLRFEGDLAAVCHGLAERFSGQASGQEAGWLRSLQGPAEEAGALYTSELDGGENLSEPGLARLLTRLLDGDQVLMLGNSLPVREVDGFAEPCRQGLRVAGNRGTSGIDGTIATAAGFAAGSERPVVLLCGDLTLFHDLNSLYLLRQIEQPVTVVVINNGGGGVFSFLPISRFQDVFERWFATPHDLQFEGAATLFKLDYHAPATRSGFVEAWQACQGRPALIEFITERSATLDSQRRIQHELADRLAAGR